MKNSSIKKFSRICKKRLKKLLTMMSYRAILLFEMSNIRKAILTQMNKSGMTIYQVAKLVEGKVPQRTVYAFLTGEKDTATETASIIMRALGLTIIAQSSKKKRRGN